MTQIVMAHPYLSIIALVVIVDGVVSIVNNVIGIWL